LGIKIRDVSEAYNDHAIGQMSLGVKIGEVFTDYSQGALRETAGKYDLALSGEGFFAVRFVDKNGNEPTKHTREGNFRLTKDGHVTDVYGNQLRTESGVLQVPLDSEDFQEQMGDGNEYHLYSYRLYNRFEYNRNRTQQNNNSW